ncbi:hypothetical protein CA54_50110 [Symmachiella macrocystis]|uniref:Putative restriction endonuclease domain-containing protein n=1 Tax=Symmachiella macrocystis TaxID=2527985 RepID=A0A5C6B7X7_9PLAN|nr:Uma2 family endonuclease [Symmachiella macrocystis]TWU06614.1 hypothetical protein CA54_50110 [Symmachiella macrocystis]
MATTILITAEEYLLQAESDRPTELVEGVMYTMNPPGFRHGQICNTIGRLLGNFVDEQQTGTVVCNDSGVITQRNPDTVRGADVAYYSYQTVPRGQAPEGYPPGPPDIVFEVLSPNDQVANIKQKTSEYLRVGVAVVCVVDDRQRSIATYRAGDQTDVFDETDELTFPNELPDFAVPVSRILA